MPINGDDITITSVSATQYLASDGLDAFNAGDLILAENFTNAGNNGLKNITCLLYTSPSPRDRTRSRMPSSA